MSYYQGDYYAGDPGFFSFVRKAIGVGSSLIPGVGGVVGKVISHIPAPVRTLGKQVGGVVVRHPVLSAAGAAGLAGAGTEAITRAPSTGAMTMPGGGGIPGIGPGGAMVHPGMMGMKGFHMSKPYKCHGTIVPSHLVRNRRMRVTNPRALRRSLRRIHGFSRIARKVLHITSPHKRGRVTFKFRRRKKA